MRKRPPVPRSLQKRERILNRAALIARLNDIGEARRAQILQRNAINEHDKLQHTYARDSPAYAASFERGHRMRENEARLAHQIRMAMEPRLLTVPVPPSTLRMPMGMTPHRGITPVGAPLTPASLLTPLGVPHTPTVAPMPPMGPPRPMSRSGFRFS